MISHGTSCRIPQAPKALDSAVYAVLIERAALQRETKEPALNALPALKQHEPCFPYIASPVLVRTTEMLCFLNVLVANSVGPLPSGPGSGLDSCPTVLHDRCVQIYGPYASQIKLGATADLMFPC
jgi:hypothetical protein